MSYTELKFPDAVVESPCVRNCCLNENDVCLGCFRELREITRWGTLNNEGKQRVLDAALERRKAYLAVSGGK